MAGKPKPRSRAERARAAARLATDGPLVPIAELTALAGVSAKTIERWIVHGRTGVYLDGVRDLTRGWCSTRAAVERAKGAHAAKLAQKGGAPC